MILRTFSVVLLLTLTIPFGTAQLKVEIDEQVKVPVLNKWVDGYVVDKRKREFLVEYEWAGGTNKKVFTRKQIRKLYEYEGLDFGRMWESENGAFKMEASLYRFDGERKVVLLNPDFKSVTVSLNKLSPKDVSYVERFRKKLDADVKRGIRPAAIPQLPEIELVDSSFGSSLAFNNEGATSELSLKPLPSYLREFKQSGMGYNLIRNGQKLIAAIPVGGPEQLVLMSFREKNPFASGERFQSQLYWASLKKKKVVNFVSITHEDYAIDYNPRHKLLLTFNRNEEFIDQVDDPDNYTIWKLNPGAKTAVPVMRFAAKGMGWAQSLFGKVVNDRVVVVKTDRSTYEAFDIKEKKSLYVLNTESFFDAPVVITHDRRHLVVPEDGFVSILDAASGKYEFSASVEDRHVSGANVNDSGTRLAAVTERSIYVWNLDSENPQPTVHPAPLMGSPFKSRVEWIDDDHILGESHASRILYRLSLNLAIWSYEMDVRQYFLNRDPLTNMVIDGKFFYVAQPDPFGGSIAVGAVNMPGPGVSDVVNDIDRESLMIIKPGVRVSLDVDKVSDPSSVREWLLAKIEKNGWIHDPEAELSMVASMGIGESQQVDYQEFISRKITTVNFKPHYANLKIFKGDLIVWQSGTSTGPPSLVRLRRGRTVQGEVNRYSKPQLNYFKNVRLEVEIIDPKYSRGFGKSSLGLRGIRVVSTSPPGRENDPRAASRQADEDRRKAAEEEGKNREQETIEDLKEKLVPGG